MKRAEAPAWLCAVPLAVMGCASYSPHLQAGPTSHHDTERAVTVDALLLDRGFGPEAFLAPDVGIRHGMGPQWDLGARLYPLGIEISSRHRVFRSLHHTLSLLPLLSCGVVTVTNADTSFVSSGLGLAALNGFRVGPEVELTVALRLGVEAGFNAVSIREDLSATRMGLLTGGSIASRFRVSERFSFSPGLLLLFPYDIDYERWRFPIMQGGVSASW